MANLSAGDSLRLLLISEDESLRDVITVALRGRLSDFRLFWVAQPELAVTRVLDLLPHLIFVDDALGGAAPAQLVKQLVQAAPASPILVLVAENAVATARPADRGGGALVYYQADQRDRLCLQPARDPGTERGDARA